MLSVPSASPAGQPPGLVPLASPWARTPPFGPPGQSPPARASSFWVPSLGLLKFKLGLINSSSGHLSILAPAPYLALCQQWLQLRQKKRARASWLQLQNPRYPCKGRLWVKYVLQV